MIPVGLARAEPSYEGLAPPWSPSPTPPELEALLGPSDAGAPPNGVHAAVRAALAGLGLDGERFGRPEWNPLGALVPRGARVVLKPNFIRHWNPSGASLDSVVTHGSVIRAVADYAWLAVGREGSVVVAEAPQHDCDFDRIRAVSGLDAIASLYRERLGVELPILDLRRECVAYRDGVIVERRSLPGDPLGYRAVDLGSRSFFADSGLDPARFRGADYDPAPTSAHHSGGRNEYLLSESVLRADLIVNLPKCKTHKKTGVTLALKNLVGVNGDKNWLPHHCVGSPSEGGDEYPGDALVDGARSRATELARRWLARGRGRTLLRLARRAETALRGDDFVRAGNWHGNDTTWRMCLDLNRCLYYSDATGLDLDAAAPRRTILTVLDGILAGDGEGPLAPADFPLGIVLAATDPVALDLAAVRLMGFDEERIPKIREAMLDAGPRVTAVRRPEDVEWVEWTPERRASGPLAALAPSRPFRPHSGWRGHVERAAAPGGTA